MRTITYLAVFTILIQIVNSTTYNIFGKTFETIFDEEISSMPIPQFLSYDRNLKIVASQDNYILRNLTLPSRREIPKKKFFNKKIFIDDKENQIEKRGDHLYLIKKQSLYKLSISETHACLINGNAPLNLGILLCKLNTDNKIKKLYVFSTDNPKIVDNQVIVEELTVFKGDILAIDVNSRGDIAVALKQTNRVWQLLVLKYNDSIEDTTLSVLTTSSTTTSTTTTTTTETAITEAATTPPITTTTTTEETEYKIDIRIDETEVDNIRNIINKDEYVNTVKTAQREIMNKHMTLINTHINYLSNVLATMRMRLDRLAKSCPSSSPTVRRNQGNKNVTYNTFSNGLENSGVKLIETFTNTFEESTMLQDIIGIRGELKKCQNEMERLTALPVFTDRKRRQIQQSSGIYFESLKNIPNELRIKYMCKLK